MIRIDLSQIGYRIAQNDHRALKILYDHYSSSFLNLAVAIVHSPETAEEIVEDVFIQVWKIRERLPSIENLHLYLYVILRNTSRSYLRKYKNKRFIDFDDITLPYFRIDLTPEDIMISGEVIHRINTAINDLPARCKLIFKLIKEDGLKHRDVAELLHMSQKTVENQLAIAVKKIHSAVKMHLPTRP